MEVAPLNPRGGWLRAAAISVFAVIVRVALVIARSPHLIDPDGYMDIARAIARAHNLPAFINALADEGALRAPLYPVFLGAIVRIAADPVVAAAMVQCLLAGVSTAGIYYVAMALSGERAALVAASLIAAWPPSLESAPALWSEHLHVPLMCVTFALAAYAIRTDRTSAFFGSGALMGAAALARAMPLFYLPVAAILIARSHLRGTRHLAALALTCGFALIAVPYVVVASSTAGYLIPIETEGTMGLYRTNPPGKEIAVAGARPPGMGAAVRITARQFAAAPVYFTRAQVSRVRGMFAPGWWFPPDARMRIPRAIAVISASIVVATFIAAIVGGWISRRALLARLLLAWIAIALVLIPLSGNTGPRYRAPLDPVIIVFAAAAPIRCILAPGRDSGGRDDAT